MFEAVTADFFSGQRGCLVGVLALGDTRDVFAGSIRNYFARWIAALAGALGRGGREAATAAALSEETVAGIQGLIVLTRALNDPAIFMRGIEDLRARLAAPAGRRSRSAPL